MTKVRLAPEILQLLTALAPVAEEPELELAGQAGSGRKYFRIQVAARSFVLQQSHPADADFERFVRYSQVFHAQGLPVPTVHAVSSDRHQVLLDDLGTSQLWDRCQQATPSADSHPDAGASLAVYQRVLAELTRWQCASAQVFAACPDLIAREFDFQALRWETEYFTEHYLQGYCHLGISDIALIGSAFDELATLVASHPRGLMHRDFQSQNVMVDDAGRIGFVDFQGTRSGSLYYDAASLLWDPYVRLDAEVVRETFLRWVSLNPMLAQSDRDHWRCFLEASLQRLMQAMGAFCNLSRNKGIAAFAQHIGPGRDRLRTVLQLYLTLPGHLDLEPLLRWVAPMREA